MFYKYGKFSRDVADGPDQPLRPGAVVDEEPSMLSHGSEAPGRSNGRRGTEAAVRLPDIDRYLDRVAPTPWSPSVWTPTTR